MRSIWCMWARCCIVAIFTSFVKIATVAIRNDKITTKNSTTRPELVFGSCSFFAILFHLFMEIVIQPRQRRARIVRILWGEEYRHDEKRDSNQQQSDRPDPCFVYFQFHISSCLIVQNQAAAKMLSCRASDLGKQRSYP